MPDLPVMLKVAGARCVIVGGGKVALRRAGSLLAAGAEVLVVSPTVDGKFANLKVTLRRRAYRAGDLRGARVVVIATNDAAVNRRVAADARKSGVLVNRADDPDDSDITVPAHAHHGPVTIAVHTGGVSAAAAATIRRSLSRALGADWPKLLAIAAPFRGRIQAEISDPEERTRRLRQLTDARALRVFKEDGPTALRRRYEALLSGPSRKSTRAKAQP